MARNIIIALVVIAAGAGGFLYFKGQQAPEPSPITDDTASTTPTTIGTSTPNVSAVVAANNQFAFELYRALRSDAGNIFFSPYSISVALAMAYEGARAGTANEMQKVFHFPTDAGVRRASYLALANYTNTPNAHYKLSIANSLWVDKSYPLLSGYTSTVEQYYGGKATMVDFRGAAEAARRTINKWVADNTSGKIPNLFPQNSLNSNTRLVLANAVYFKGTWVKQFERSKTTNESFTVNATRSVTVPMMQRTDKDAVFKYTEMSGMQILELPYEGDRLAMYVLLPKTAPLSALESSITLSNLNTWRKALKAQRVNVFLPKFTVNAKYAMNDTLSALGMPMAFAPNADFSGMDGTKMLSIQSVVHQAFAAVDEEGTEAAAATGVSIGITSAPDNPPPTFRADHPFVFVIQDMTNGNILFMGRMSNPAE